MPEFFDRIAIPPEDLADEAECGHLVVLVDGVEQHHEIPDDGAPHAATTECGCGPQCDTAADGHVLLIHAEQSKGGWCGVYDD